MISAVMMQKVVIPTLVIPSLAEYASLLHECISAQENLLKLKEF